MMSMNDLRAIDRDGALEEAVERVGHTRGAFFGRAAVAAGGLIGGGAVLGMLPSVAAAQSTGDVDILNFALTLEELETAFYADAIAKAGLSGDAATLAKEVGAHEAAHVAALRRALGTRAIAKPTFDFGAATQSQTAFLKTAVTLEDTGVAAYKGQAPLIEDAGILAAALSIHSVEAKHAAWVRRVSKGAPAPAAFEGPRTRAQVLAAVQATGFLKS
jgi:rubrerythrin